MPDAAEPEPVPGFETLCGHWGDTPERFLGAPAPPIYQNSLFTAPNTAAFLDRAARHPEVYDYTRCANPTTDVLEAKLAALEHAEACRCFGSGMAAVSAAVMHAVRAGSHVVAVDTLYGPARQLLTEYLPRFEVTTTFVPGRDPADFTAALRPETSLFYLESPSSLVFRQQDLAAVAAIARAHGVTTVVDNSWASPYFQNPLDFGIDLVLHSATKYLGGHSDLVAGAVMGNRERLQVIGEQEGRLIGGILDPFAAWLLLRGVRTLTVRMERHRENAGVVAAYLEAHPRIARVHYPGLASHPQQDLTARQLRGCSGLLSLELRDSSREAACRMVDGLRYFGIGVSWGGFESLAIPVALGPDRWAVRLHIGLETAADLLADLEQALRD
jgi:cystathionine beta-lyase/cystathionine gamma-synthase